MNDPDDWGASAMALAIFAKQGWQDRVVHIDYNNWLHGNKDYKSAEETMSMVEGARRFNFAQTKLFDCQTDLDAAVASAADEINKSSSTSRFWYVQAGPFEVAYQALKRADPDKRKYCILVSHSEMNERAGKWPGQHGKDDCVALGAGYYFTTGQGRDKFGSGKFKEWHLVDWMKDSPCPEYRWVYSRFRKTAEHKNGVLDASDGGMAFALATGYLDGNFNPKLKDFLGTGWAASPMSVDYDAQIPQLAFAAQELKTALAEAGREGLHVTLGIKGDSLPPEGFRILTERPNQIEVVGSDATGAMYGGLELAERLRLGLPIENVERTPFIQKRGIKFNIPWDARTPSYDDTGDNAQANIETVWDFEGFWRPYLDDLARYRYNVLSLWSTHPYPSIIKLDDYPEVALDDVYRIGVDLKPEYKNKFQELDFGKPGTLRLVKKMTIDEKIAHWRRVFHYAEDRGIEIYLFHWNVFTFGATGKHGITEDQTNDITIDYLRKSVRQALLTYPNIKGIGVTAGENADNQIKGKYSIENFLFNTYGRGIMDVKEVQPDRKVRFIFRRHMTGLGPIKEAFSEFNDDFDTSFKYIIGHMYGPRDPKLFDIQFRREVEEFNVPCWQNLRNDDLFVFRWGSPDYVRDYLENMPLDVMPGFYMGSDGYVWGRETIAKNPELAGRLEIDKHWYRFRMWGELAYNPALGRDYWEDVLEERFPGVDSKLLYDAWAAVSEVVPEINTVCWKPNDAMIAPEGCIDNRGFLTIDRYYFDPVWNKSLPRSGYLSVKEWGEAAAAGKTPDGISPLEVADRLDAHAQLALDALPSLRESHHVVAALPAKPALRAGSTHESHPVVAALPVKPALRAGSTHESNAELVETLNDIEAIAYLGRYYADKMCGACKLAAFRQDISQKHYSAEAIKHLKDAVKDWEAYASIASSQYKPQLMARTSFMDWNRITKEVKREVISVAQEADYPDVQITNLNDGARLSAGSVLEIQVTANDKDGIREVKLYLNGLLLKGKKEKGFSVWNSSTDGLLNSLKSGTVHLLAVAMDETGTFGRQEIKVTVGDRSGNDPDAWKDEIHQLILRDGERLVGDERREFQRLESDFRINEEGRLMLHGVVSGTTRNRVLLWKASMHRDRTGGPYYAVLERGRLTTYRAVPGKPEVKIFQTPEVSGNAPYKLAITAAKRLVILSEDNQIVWTGN